MKKKVLSIDIGGSKIIVGLVDEQGKVLTYEKSILPLNYDIDLVIDKVCGMAEPFLLQKPVAAGVTIPGLADPQNGIWKYAPFSAIAEIPIADILRKRLNLRVFIENDVNACAIGEKLFGNCKDCDDFLWVTVSNGIGGALYLNGELYAGGNNNAGEIGHFVVEEDDGAICGCGSRGCLEAMASGKGIEAAYFKATGSRSSAEEIAILAQKGDSKAQCVYEKAGYYIGKALSYCINILNLEKIVLGGGVCESFELFQKNMLETLDKFVFKQANATYSVEKTGLGYHAALIGAAAVALKNIYFGEEGT